MRADPSGGIEVLEWSSVKNKAPVALAPNKHLLVVPKSTCQLACKKARKHQVSTLAIWRNCGGRRLQRTSVSELHAHSQCGKHAQITAR